MTPYLEQVLGMGTVQASTTLMAYGVFCLISNILGGWIDARFGMKALLVTFVLQAAALFGLFAVGAVGAAFSLVAWVLTLVTIRLARWERKRARA